MVSALFFDTNGIYPYTSLIQPDSRSLKEIPDSVFFQRMMDLNLTTPMEMVYNQEVRRYIEMYAGRRFAQMQRMMGLAHLYFPLFEATLDKYDVPLELKYLAIVESALNPTARSRAGAKGLWQFMYSTGKIYGLQVSSMVDDRFDPIKATDAAARHLRDLHDIFGDWSLALAAYNSGAGNVTRALRRSGGVKSYWAIQPFLPRETRSYVPAFMAVAYLWSYADLHGIVADKPSVYYQETDTISIRDVLAFDQISELHAIPIETIRALNPSFIRDVIPGKPDNPYTLRIPRHNMPRFISLEDSVYRYVTSSGVEKQKLLAEVKKAEERMTHVVRSGENLGSIARKYNCRVSDLMSWNGLRTTRIYPRQRLVVFSKSSSASVSVKSVNTHAKNGKHTVQKGETPGGIANAYGISLQQLREWNNLRSDLISSGQVLKVRAEEISPTSLAENSNFSKYVSYTVQSGDTLWDIAKRYEGVSADDIRNANNISSAQRLKPGQELKIPVKS